MESHRCKICCKCFPCGRSLGGHMRSHMRFHSAEAGKGKLAGRPGDSNASYVLRENPKKMWRQSDFVKDESSPSSLSLTGQQCKECGKGFPSSKALFGHMRCHSTKSGRQRSQAVEKQEHDQEQGHQEEEQGSWSWHEFFHESTSEDNAPAAESRWNRSSNLASPAIHTSSMTVYDQELQEVAISLMMLSRDASGCWSPANETSDKHSLVLEEEKVKLQSELGEFGCEYLEAEDFGNEPRRQKTLNLAEFGKKTPLIDEKNNCLNACEPRLGRTKLKLDSTHQCTSCNRKFSSYQALGGHRASHKRIRSCCLKKYDPGMEGGDANVGQMALENEVSNPCHSKKNRIHECRICGKTFSSGQALGGHKRSHIVPSTDNQCDIMGVAADVKVPELLDLNFPAPVDEESSNTEPWRTPESIVHEQHLLDFVLI